MPVAFKNTFDAARADNPHHIHERAGHYAKAAADATANDDATANAARARGALAMKQVCRFGCEDQGGS